MRSCYKELNWVNTEEKHMLIPSFGGLSQVEQSKVTW